MNNKTTGPIKSNHQIQLAEEYFYRNHRLISYQKTDRCIGEVFKNNARIAYCESLSIEAALQTIRTIVDDQIVSAIVDRNNAAPSQSELSEAIRSVFPSLSPQLQSLLCFLKEAKDKQLSLDALSSAAECQRTTDVSLLFAQLARLLCDVVAYEPPTPINGRDPFLAMLLEATERCPNIQKPITLTLNDDFFKALNALKEPFR